MKENLASYSETLKPIPKTIELGQQGTFCIVFDKVEISKLDPKNKVITLKWDMSLPSAWATLLGLIVELSMLQTDKFVLFNHNEKLDRMNLFPGFLFENLLSSGLLNINK